MLNSKQRAYLMSLAANLEPVVQVGKSGVSPETIDSLEEAFHTRELLKVNIQKTSRMNRPSPVTSCINARTASL